MRFYALATDYDGTLAENGNAAPQALEALRQLSKSGRKAILVTGRLLSDLRTVLPELELFDAIVAENGAILYDTSTREQYALATPPSAHFIEALRTKNVSPLDVGSVIVSTWHPHEETVLQTIRELGLDLTVIFNKGAVMVLPAGINKATGLAAQLSRMGLLARNVAGIGDAENDLPFLAQCEASAATANAIDSVKGACDVTTKGDHGLGVAEFAQCLIDDDLFSLSSLPAAARDRPWKDRGRRTHLRSGGSPRRLASRHLRRRQDNVGDRVRRTITRPKLSVFASSIRKATTKALRERSVSVVPAVRPISIKSPKRSKPNVVISLLAVPQADRPTYAQRVFARINDVHVSVGRPHWLFVDEAHHALPVPSNTLAPIDFGPSVFLITTRPELIAPSALASVEVVIAVGDDPGGTISSTRTILGETEPASEITLDHAHTGTAVVWKRSAPEQQLVIATASPTGERRRHIRKYAEGELAPEKSFYFKGPENKQNLRAQNLMTFIALADGIDDETWLHHLKQHDYSN